MILLFRVQIRIDDREVLAASIENEKLVMGSNQSSLYFGGIPEKFAQNQELNTNESLIGCISDFQLNYE